MHKYKSYLEEQMQQLHTRMFPARSADDMLSVTQIMPSPQPTEGAYLEVEEVLSTANEYEPVFLNDFAPDDRYQRRHWIDNLRLQFPVMMYKYAIGSSVGTMCFAWKVPHNIDHTTISQIIAKLNSTQSVYATRAMRKDFLDKYNRLAKTPKGVPRSMYKTFMEDSSASNRAAEKEVDDRVAAALLDLDDPQIIIDLRELNGNPKSMTFDIFWEELSQYLEETTVAVDERWHSDVMHMPLAISVRHLRDIIVERLQDKHSTMPLIPSLDWCNSLEAYRTIPSQIRSPDTAVAKRSPRYKIRWQHPEVREGVCGHAQVPCAYGLC